MMGASRLWFISGTVPIKEPNKKNNKNCALASYTLDHLTRNLSIFRDFGNKYSHLIIKLVTLS